MRTPVAGSRRRRRPLPGAALPTPSKADGRSWPALQARPGAAPPPESEQAGEGPASLAHRPGSAPPTVLE